MNNLNFLKNNVIAHRGYHDISKGIPENTLPAFQRAVDLKYAIELDIHILKDNTVVVFHDDDLKRMAGIDKPLKDYTYDELKKINLQNTQNHIPTLEEVLQLINGKVPLLIEFKTDYNLKGLIKESMKLLKDYKGKYAVQSFHPAFVNYFRKNFPNIPRGQLAYDFKKDKIPHFAKLMLRNMFFNFLTNPDFISYNIDNYNLNKVFKWKKKRTLLGWTVKDKKQYEANKDIFDILICENIDEYFQKGDGKKESGHSRFTKSLQVTPSISAPKNLQSPNKANYIESHITL